MTKRGLRDCSWNKVNESKILDYEWKIYDHALEGSPEKTYDYWLACLLKQIKRSRRKDQDNHEKKLIDHLEIGSGTQQVKLMSEVTEKDEAAPTARVAKAQSKYNAQAMAAVTGKANAAAGNKSKTTRRSRPRP